MRYNGIRAKQFYCLCNFVACAILLLVDNIENPKIDEVGNMLWTLLILMILFGGPMGFFFGVSGAIVGAIISVLVYFLKHYAIPFITAILVFFFWGALIAGVIAVLIITGTVKWLRNQEDFKKIFSQRVKRRKGVPGYYGPNANP